MSFSRDPATLRSSNCPQMLDYHLFWKFISYLGQFALVFIRKPTKNFHTLFPACTILYQLVQARKVRKVASLKARSKFLQAHSENPVQHEQSLGWGFHPSQYVLRVIRNDICNPNPDHIY